MKFYHTFIQHEHSMEVKLDEHQRKAVEHFEGPALVVAGPGSGKTTVIKERILNLIQEHKVNPQEILAIAFTKMAAKEMEQRIPELNELSQHTGRPEIRTLHSFGLHIIKQNYRQLDLAKAPNVWKAFELVNVIKEEINHLKREKANASVLIYIYRIGSKVTDKCYIGQTTNWKRRRKEHFFDSSNIGLRGEIQAEGRENFYFEVIDEVEGRFADYYEAKWIEYYRNLTVFNSESESEKIDRETLDSVFSIFKIESIETGRCYIGYTLDPKWTEDNFECLENNELQKAIENESYEQFVFEVIEENVPGTKVIQSVTNHIEVCKNNAVFNQNNPLTQRYSDRLLIELFCEHFDICYEDLLRSPSVIDDFTEKLDNFEEIAADVEKAKRQVTTEFFNANSIDDVVCSIVKSIADPVVKAFAEEYEKKKKRAVAVDFQDMINYPTYLLRTYPDLRKQYINRYSYVHVDEFQDISPADYELIKLLSDNLFAVGDDDQAIYGFRGGDSEIMREIFGEQKNVVRYNITQNYRSTSGIVELSKGLILNNKDFRIPKDLRSKKPFLHPMRVLETTEETINSTILREFAEPICQMPIVNNRIATSENTVVEIPMDMQKIGIPVRFRSEVDKVRNFLQNNRFKEVKRQQKAGDPCRFLGRSNKEIIEVSTIHSMKGKEYVKVILIHNTLGEDFPFQDSDNIIEERRVFYVAMTRAKQELVIIGGKCLFVEELHIAFPLDLQRSSKGTICAIKLGGKILFTSDWLKILQLEVNRIHKRLESAITHRISTFEEQLSRFFEVLTRTLKSQRTRMIDTTKLIEETKNRLRREYEPDFESLRRKITDNQDEMKKIESSHPLELSNAQDNVVKKLIPIYDKLDLIVNEFNESTVINESQTEFTNFYENIQSAQLKLLEVLKNQGLKPIDKIDVPLNLMEHEEKRERVFSNEVPKENIVRIISQGYKLKGQVIYKAQVVLSKGKKQSEWLKNLGFAKLSIYTEDSSYTLHDVRMHPDSIRGVENNGSVVHIRKSELLFAYPKRHWQIIAEEILNVDTKLKRRPYTDEFLRCIIGQQKNIGVDQGEYKYNYVLKGCYLLQGYLQSFDRDVLYLSINKRIAVVFRQGLLGIYTDAELEEVLSVEKCNPNSKLDTSQQSKQKSDRITSSKIDSSKLGKSKKPSVEIGRHLNGIVKNITTFGAFVDLRDIDGLIHKSELTWKKISHPSEVVSVGDEVEVKVIKIDREGKIGLSLKQMTSDPWAGVEEKYQVGLTVKGTVVNIVHYGAFIQLEEGIDGLLHASEMLPTDNGISWKDVLNVGDEVKVAVLEISKDSKRITLSMKQTQENRLKLLLQKYPDKNKAT